jgi:ABC-2 type transport system ATP-binding protein
MQIVTSQQIKPAGPVQPELVTPPAGPVIKVHKVCKQFEKGKPTIQEISFEVQRGEIFCLLGPSGSGKSTTMRMLTGVYQPNEGYIRVLGVEPHNFTRQTRARIGYMPQNFVLFPELSTIDNINFVASAYGMSWFGRAAKVREALEFVNLWEARDLLASQLSGGMRRRLDLAGVLVHRPELIFFDEPTAGIDPVLRAKFWDHFKALSAEGRTLFVTTQYVTEADHCDKVAILSRGRLLALGTPEEVRKQAMGGGIINLKLDEVTAQTLRLLRSIPGIKNILTISPEKLRLIVEDTGQVLKEVVSCFQQNDLEIQNIEPYRPDFEEVFVRLLENDTGLEKDLEEKEPLLPDQSLPVSVLAHLEKGSLPPDFPHPDSDTRKESA